MGELQLVPYLGLLHPSNSATGTTAAHPPRLLRCGHPTSIAEARDIIERYLEKAREGLEGSELPNSLSIS